MKKITIDYKRVNKGHYSPGIIHNGLLYISGQLSIDPETGIKPEGGIVPETRQALSNLDDVLKAAGVERDKVISCRIYISDIIHWNQVNEVYSEFFGEHKPVRAVVPTRPLHFDCLIEIEAIAAIS